MKHFVLSMLMMFALNVSAQIANVLRFGNMFYGTDAALASSGLNFPAHSLIKNETYGTWHTTVTAGNWASATSLSNVLVDNYSQEFIIGTQLSSQDSLMWQALSNVTTTFKPIKSTIGTVAGGAGRYTWTYPSAFPSGVVPIVQVVAVKPTGATIAYNAAIYGDPTNTSVTVEVNTTNTNVVVGLLNAILPVSNPAPNGTKVHITAMAP